MVAQKSGIYVEPGRFPGARRWSRESREIKTARVCKVEYQRGDYYTQREK